MWIIASLILAYLVGSIPFSLVIGRRVKGIDLREHGSGNLGATNVYRTLGPGWGGMCLLLDVAKGVAAVLAMTAVVHAWPDGESMPLRLTGDMYRILAGLVAVLGHSFSPFAGFRGGKGIATSFGVFLVLEPFPVLFAFAVFLAVFFATRIVSLGSLSAAAVFPWAVLLFEYRSPKPFSKTLIVFSFLMAALVVWRHRANIQRLRDGTEKTLAAPLTANGDQPMPTDTPDESKGDRP
ncbi:MAG: glycerol-3-phosphate 1-O-acyltransferase PlsY [Candidatus Krumholzibacteria bacterium]|nr:glycerol-3-phosphate 1-O-acyltransferase PlsY [Candidatus Krumholzibacteria bacterium]